MPTQTINLNVIPSGVPPIVNVSQNDSGWTILLSLMKGREPFTLSSGYSYTLCGTKPTGTGFSYDDAVSMIGSNVLSFNTNTVMTAVAGDVRCGIIIYDGEEHVETLNFILHVQRTALDADTIIDSSDFGYIISDAVIQWMNDNGVVIDTTLTNDNAAAEAKATGDAIGVAKRQAFQSGLTYDVKQALLNCFSHVIWDSDSNKQTYYNALEEALYDSDWTLYDLEPSASVIKYNPNTGIVSPSIVTLTAYEYVNGTRSAYGAKQISWYLEKSGTVIAVGSAVADTMMIHPVYSLDATLPSETDETCKFGAEMKNSGGKILASITVPIITVTN